MARPEVYLILLTVLASSYAFFDTNSNSSKGSSNLDLLIEKTLSHPKTVQKRQIPGPESFDNSPPFPPGPPGSRPTGGFPGNVTRNGTNSRNGPRRQGQRPNGNRNNGTTCRDQFSRKNHNGRRNETSNRPPRETSTESEEQMAKQRNGGRGRKNQRCVENGRRNGNRGTQGRITEVEGVSSGSSTEGQRRIPPKDTFEEDDQRPPSEGNGFN